MTPSALFLAEGTSDAPLRTLVDEMCLRQNTPLQISAPDFGLLAKKVSKDLRSKIEAGVQLLGSPPDVVILHRDADGAGRVQRLTEMQGAIEALAIETHLLPIVPVRMTEAWLLLDEESIRRVAGNPNGSTKLELPTPREAERLADPKSALKQALLDASGQTGRKRQTLAARFSNSRRQLLASLDLDGPVNKMDSWKMLVADVQALADKFKGPSQAVR